MVLLQANIHEPTQDEPAGRGSLADRGVDGPADRRMLRLGSTPTTVALTTAADSCDVRR
jgi:hypothetical protein